LQSLEASRSLMDQTYEVILNAPCDGTLKSGERLTQEEIAARLNVSRQPVTHALAVLKSQGFVVPSGRRGLTVTPVEPRFFEAIYQFRSAVEPLAVSLATPRLTKQSIARGRSLIKHGRDLVAVGDRLACLQADMDFHLFIYELARNPLILETMRLYWRHIQRAMGQVLACPGMSMTVWQEHRRILEHMIRGEADEAGELMRWHLVDACARVLKPEAA